MFDTHRAYVENDNPIRQLVNRESRMQQVDIESPLKVKFSENGNTLQFIYNGLVLNGKVDRPLKHQLGGRAWGENNSFKTINETWLEKFELNRFELAQELAAVFSRNDLCIRYSSDKQGSNKVYGIVTPYFIDVNQLEFRENFVKQVRQMTGLISSSKGIEIGRFGEVIEYFNFDSAGFQTEFRYGLVYARNNGYEAYKVNWERLVLICTNGLTEWRGRNINWKHTKKIDLADFITQTVEDGIGNQKFLEERIAASRNTLLNHNRIGELMERLSLAKASKARVTNQLEDESKKVGNNEWALSQSLTSLGSHEKGIPTRRRMQLIGLGTDVLENSLDEVLEEESQIHYDGSYGLVLPKAFQRDRLL